MPLALLRQLTLASLMTLGLTACGGSSGGGPEPDSSSNSSSTSSSVSSASQTSSSSSESAESSSSVSSTSRSSLSSASSVSTSSSSSSISSSPSSSSSSSIAPPDLEPALFSFEAQTDVEPGAIITSNAITVNEINAATSISISGGQYAVNGGNFTNADGEVESGESVTVQVTASENFSAETAATLTIGGVNGTFTVTTEAEDTTPDAFGFAPQDGLNPETEVLSEPVTITSINTSVVISIEGGEYQIDDGEFTADAGEVSEGSSVTLRAVTLEGPDQTQEVNLSVGTESALWAVTTAPDEEPPVGEIAFPPPMSASGAETLTIRGRASDELSGVAEVTLTVHHEDSVVPYTLEPDEETGFAEWQQSITLAPGENRVSLQVKDEAGNELEEPVEVTVVGQDYTMPFPDDEQRLFSIEEMVYDEVRNRLLLLGDDEDEGVAEDRAILAVDLDTGIRSVFATDNGENEMLDLRSPDVGSIDTERNRLIVARSSGSAIYEIDLETGNGAELLQSRSGHGATDFDKPSGITVSSLDPDSIYVLSSGLFYGDYNRLLKVNLATGEREVISDPEAGVGSGPDFGVGRGLSVSKDKALAYIYRSRYLYTVNLTSGDRTEIILDYPADNSSRALSDIFLAGEEEDLHIFEVASKGLMKKEKSTGDWTVIHPYGADDDFDARISDGAHYMEEDNYLFVAQDYYKVVFAYDLTTNEFVVITRYSE